MIEIVEMKEREGGLVKERELMVFVCLRDCLLCCDFFIHPGKIEISPF